MSFLVQIHYCPLLLNIFAGEPPFDEIDSLIDQSTVDLTELVEALDKVVNSLIENGQTASRKFSEVSCFLDSLYIEKMSSYILHFVIKLVMCKGKNNFFKCMNDIS